MTAAMYCSAALAFIGGVILGVVIYAVLIALGARRSVASAIAIVAPVCTAAYKFSDFSMLGTVGVPLLWARMLLLQLVMPIIAGFGAWFGEFLVHILVAASERRSRRRKNH